MTAAAVAEVGTWAWGQLGSTGRWEQAGVDQGTGEAGWDGAVGDWPGEAGGHTAHLHKKKNERVNAYTRIHLAEQLHTSLWGTWSCTCIGVSQERIRTGGLSEGV